MARKAVVLREIARLQNASPEVDFAANWAKGDKRFVGINGVGGYFPSLPKERVLALLNQYGATTIEGTGDVMEFPEQEELGRLAMIYATRYNPLLLKKLDEENAVN